MDSQRLFGCTSREYTCIFSEVLSSNIMMASGCITSWLIRNLITIPSVSINCLAHLKDNGKLSGSIRPRHSLVNGRSFKYRILRFIKWTCKEVHYPAKYDKNNYHEKSDNSYRKHGNIYKKFFNFWHLILPYIA